MPLIKTILAVICVIFLMQSCKKTTDLSNASIDPRIMKAGYPANMEVTKYDTSIYTNHFEQRFDEVIDLDLNQDGIKDLRLLSHTEDSNGIKDSDSYSALEVLNQACKVWYYTTDDSIFTYSNSYRSNPTTIVSSQVFTCRNFGDLYRFHHYEEGNKHISAVYFGENIELNGLYTNEFIYLMDKPKSILIQETMIGDTTEFVYMRYDSWCNLFPIGEEVYLGFKISENGEERHGWIKLRVFAISGINLLETAIKSKGT